MSEPDERAVWGAVAVGYLAVVALLVALLSGVAIGISLLAGEPSLWAAIAFGASAVGAVLLLRWGARLQHALTMRSITLDAAPGPSRVLKQHAWTNAAIAAACAVLGTGGVSWSAMRLAAVFFALAALLFGVRAWRERSNRRGM